MSKGNSIIIIVIILLNAQFILAQITPPKTPVFGNNRPFPNSPKPTPPSPHMGYKPPVVPPSDPLKRHEFINNQAKQYRNNQEASRKAVAEALKDDNSRNTKVVRYNLPLSNAPSSKHYQTAFEELTKMEDSNFSVKKANFTVENAYYENKGKQENFDNLVSQIGVFLKKKMKDFGYDPSSNLAKNLILLQFFSDTLKLKSVEHLPFKYDFDDYMANKDWASMFVLKLLATNKGQCHSMPLLYLILAEEIEAKAFLSFSPNHSYIKFQDEKSIWYNVELTNGMLTTDAFILSSGYVKAEALQNDIYMSPLNEKQLLSQMMVDLAQGYSIKYGYDSFVEKVINKAIELYPKNINAHMVLSNYRTWHFKYVNNQLNLSPQTINRYPQAKALLDKMLAQYKVVDELGFAEMPLDEYEKWLKSLEEEKDKQESEQMKLNLNKIIILENDKM